MWRFDSQGRPLQVFGDGEDARHATFGSDPAYPFDGPYALSLDEQGNIYVGDTQNHVVRMIEQSTGKISTIAGHRQPASGVRNPLTETDPFCLRFRMIGSMEYWNERLFVPEWDLSAGTSDVIVLSRQS